MNPRKAGTALAAGLAATAVLLASCGSGSGSGSGSGAATAEDTGTHAMSDGMVMDGARQGGPSETASMICGDEIRGAVRRNLALADDPVGVHSWSHRLFRCTYRLAGGDLRLSVKDLDAAGPGRAYFDSLRHRLPGATTIKGLANFGFPAFETPRGDVVFIKDHKTLWVDATHLGARSLPQGSSRADIAYGVASAVIGCWTE